MASFANVPDVPLEGLNLAESGLFKALKENVEILAGVRPVGIHAVTNDLITTSTADVQQLKRTTAQPNATSYTNGANLAAQTGAIVIINYTEFFALVADVQNIANDVGRLQDIVHSLIGQLQK